MTADTSISRTGQLLKCPKYDRTCVIALLKHSCWSAIILGGIMLALGIVLRSSVIKDHSPTVTSSGLLFILIGIFIICLGPFAAIYDVLSKRKRRLTAEAESGTTASDHHQSQTAPPPSYDQVMSTSAKTPSATYSMRFSELSANELPAPPPPSYQEVADNNSHYLNPNSLDPTDARRMTSP